MYTVFIGGKPVATTGTNHAALSETDMIVIPGKTTPEPYVNVGRSTNLTEGPTTTRIAGKKPWTEASRIPVSEAAPTAPEGLGLKSHTWKNVTRAKATLSTVQIEGQFPIREGDPTEQNCQCDNGCSNCSGEVVTKARADAALKARNEQGNNAGAGENVNKPQPPRRTAGNNEQSLERAPDGDTKSHDKCEIKTVELTMEVRSGPKTVQGTEDGADLVISCKESVDAMTASAKKICVHGAAIPTEDILWMWEGKERGRGTKPGSLPQPSRNWVGEIILLARVALGKTSVTRRVKLRQTCQLQKPTGDEELLTRVVYAEAGSRASDEELAAIAWTVINRRNLIGRAGGTDAEVRRSFGARADISTVVAHTDRRVRDGRQYKSYHDRNNEWRALDNLASINCDSCDRMGRTVDIARNALRGERGDPYANEGGSYFFHLSATGVIRGEQQYRIKRLPKRAGFIHYFWTYII